MYKTKHTDGVTYIYKSMMDRYSWLFTFLSLVVSVTVLTGTRECPDNWTVFRDSCYLFGHGIGLSFYEAEAFCRQQGGHIVHIEDNMENLFLKDYLRALKISSTKNKIQTDGLVYNYSNDFWIGLTDERIENIWVWYDTNTTAEFTDWYPGEPNTYHGHNEDCVEFNHRLKFQWNDEMCNATNQAICEISGNTDNTDIIG